MRAILLALALAATARGVAQKTRTAPRDAAAAFFHNPAATVLHETEAFRAGRGGGRVLLLRSKYLENEDCLLTRRGR